MESEMRSTGQEVYEANCNYHELTPHWNELSTFDQEGWEMAADAARRVGYATGHADGYAEGWRCAKSMVGVG